MSLSLLLVPSGFTQPETNTLNNRILESRTMIDDAARLKLTETQVAGLWSRLASDYEDLGDFTHSEAAYIRALGLFEHIPEAQESFAVTLGNLGSLYQMTGRFDAEENCRKRSLAIFERLGLPLQVARAQARLAEGYLAMGKNKQAERYSAEAMQTFASQPKATAEDKGSVLVTYAYAACLTGHCAEGLHRAQEAMAIVRGAFAAESFPSGQTHVALGFLEERTGDSVHAEEDLQEGVRILRLNLPPSHPLLRNALEIYRDFLAANHRDVEAKRLAGEGRTAACDRCTVSVWGLQR